MPNEEPVAHDGEDRGDVHALVCEVDKGSENGGSDGAGRRDVP